MESLQQQNLKNQIRARSKGKLEERDRKRLEREQQGKVKTYRGFKRRRLNKGGSKCGPCQNTKVQQK